MTHATFFYSIFSLFGIFRVISLNRSLSTIRLLSLLSYFAFSERVILNRIAKIPVHAVIVPSLETMHSWNRFWSNYYYQIERGESLARSGAIFYPNFWIRRQKKEKRKNVLFFRFCNGERVSIGNISRGKVGQPRRNGQSCHFPTGEFHGNERWSEDDSRRLTRRTSRRVKWSTG